MIKEELCELLSENLLLEIVCNYIEDQQNVQNFVKNVDSKLTKEITFAEIQNCESLDIIEYESLNNKINITFGLSYVLMVWKEDKCMARVTAYAEGKCFVPDIDSFNWDSYNFDDMNKQELLGFKKNIEISEIKNIEEEFDDLSIL